MKNTPSKYAAQQRQTPQRSIGEILHTAAKSGIAGGVSMAINVFGFMWMRTTMNYQYKNGGSLAPTLKKLYAEGGVVRFYRGIIPALVVAPVGRFGDTACNSFALNISENSPSLKNLPQYVQTSIGSSMAGLWKLFTIPFDAWKTAKQVHGSQGLNILVMKFRSHGVMAFYQGGAAAAMSSMVSHFGWYATNNYLQLYIPKVQYSQNSKLAVIRNAGLGAINQLMNDTVSNGIKVVKTVKQTSKDHITYSQIVKEIISKEGLQGLLFRGFKTKLISNIIQSSYFKTAWSFIQEKMNTSKN